MHLRIGKFNNIPLYLNIPTPLKFAKKLLSEEKTIAFIRQKPLIYDQQKAKYEGSISTIHQKELYVTKELPIEERTRGDHVYEFYRNKDELIDWYMLSFKDICNMDYQHYFDWNGFLKEIGWELGW